VKKKTTKGKALLDYEIPRGQERRPGREPLGGTWVAWPVKKKGFGGLRGCRYGVEKSRDQGNQSRVIQRENTRGKDQMRNYLGGRK